MSWWTSTAATVSGLVLPVAVLVAWTLSPGLRLAMGAVFPLASRTLEGYHGCGVGVPGAPLVNSS